MRREIEVYIWSWLADFRPEVMFRAKINYTGSKSMFYVDIPRVYQDDGESEREFMFRIWGVASEAIIAAVTQRDKELGAKDDTLRMLPKMRQFQGQRIDIGLE